MTDWVSAVANHLPGPLAANASWVAAAIGAVGGGLASWPLNKVFGFIFRVFNHGFDYTSRLYTWSVGRLLRISLVVLVAYGFLLYLTYVGFNQTPKGFIPSQDKGYLVVNLQLPDSASVGRTEQVMQRIEKTVIETPGVKHTVGISGQSILLGREFTELWRHVHHVGRFSRSSVARLGGRRHRQPAAGQTARRNLGRHCQRAGARRRWKV